MIRVRIPTPLRSYTGGRAELACAGATVDAVLRDLDAQCPGIRFRMIDEQDRIRPHIQIFLRDELLRSIDRPVDDGETLMIVGALSGG